MIALELRFPGRRYHATPWDHHVNEGIVEWPPSAWRLLRALICTRELKARDGVDETTWRGVVTRLSAASPPVYRLPPVVVSHTRHYMPQEGGSPTEVFDTFLHLPEEDTLTVVWPDAALRPEERQALALVVDRLSYLGRAESWVEARLLADDVGVQANAAPWAADSEPVRPAGPPGSSRSVRLLVPMAEDPYREWRRREEARLLDRRLESKRRRAEENGRLPDSVKLSGADRKKIAESLPVDTGEALLVDTGSLRKRGWSRPPGSEWVEYERPVPRELTAMPPTRRRSRKPLPTVARFAVADRPPAASDDERAGSRTVPPRLTEAVQVAERVRRALMSRSKDADDEVSPVFSGKRPDGAPIAGHRHAFILPEANGRHGYITHLTVYAPMGFDSRERRALDALVSVYGHGDPVLHLVLLGVGQPQDFGGIEVEIGRCPLFAESEVWESRTPFVPTRHPKTYRDGRPKLDENGLPIGSAEHDLRRLLREGDLPEPSWVAPLHETNLGGKPVRWLAFSTQRKRGAGRRGEHPGTGFRLTFPEAVRGPLALGYGAHFGLGVFVPVETARRVAARLSS